MQLLVNPADDLPLYRQIMREILEAIAGGRLKSGETLASHRELSEQIVVAPLTGNKAYDELEALGYIETRRGRGTFVCDSPPRVDRREQMERIQQDARRLLSQASLAGIQLPEVVEILKNAGRAIGTPSGPGARREKEKA